MKIGIFRALYLGDVLCSVPALELLKREFPTSTICFIGLPQLRDFVMRFSFIDFYIDFPGCEGIPEQAWDKNAEDRFILECIDENFDLLIQMHGNGSVINEFLTKIKGPRLVGFCPKGQSSDSNWFPYPSDKHEILRHLELLGYLGINYSCKDTKINYPIFENEYTDFETMRDIFNLKDYIVFHIGSKNEQRRWKMENFAELARYLQKMNKQIVCTGTSGEYSLIQSFSKQLDQPIINLAGLTNYGLLGCVIKYANMLICNCTGVSHVAAALQIKSLVISMDGEPDRWGPLNKSLHITVNALEEVSVTTLRSKIDDFLNIP